MKTIFIHIGNCPKSSNALNRYFHSCGKELRELGALYPESGRPRIRSNVTIMQHESLAYSFCENRSHPPHSHQLAAKIDSARFANNAIQMELREEIANFPGDVLILSSDYFFTYGSDHESNNSAGRLKEYFSEHDVRIVAYLQRPDRHLTSHYKQIISNGDYVPRMRDAHQNWISEYFLNYEKALAPWIDSFGRDRMLVADLDKIGENDIVRSFFEITGLSHLHVAEKTGLSPNPVADHLIESLRVWNSVCNGGAMHKSILQTLKLLVNKAIVPESVKVDFLDADGRRELYKHCVTQNNFIVKHFGKDAAFEDPEDILDQGKYEITDLESFERYNAIVMMDLTRKSFRSNTRPVHRQKKEAPRLTTYRRIKKSIARTRTRFMRMLSGK